MTSAFSTERDEHLFKQMMGTFVPLKMYNPPVELNMCSYLLLVNILAAFGMALSDVSILYMNTLRDILPLRH